jgi:hypothetical protein
MLLSLDARLSGHLVGGVIGQIMEEKTGTWILEIDPCYPFVIIIDEPL